MPNGLSRSSSIDFSCLFTETIMGQSSNSWLSTRPECVSLTHPSTFFGFCLQDAMGNKNNTTIKDFLQKWIWFNHSIAGHLIEYAPSASTGVTPSKLDAGQLFLLRKCKSIQLNFKRRRFVFHGKVMPVGRVSRIVSNWEERIAPNKVFNICV